jgi:hypothetical protein
MKYTRIKSIIDIPYSDLEHHKMRVLDILYKKAPLNTEKQCKLAKTMADKIEKVDKAFGRYLVSEELKAPHLAKIFLNRFKELTYSLQDLRKDKILQIFSEIENEEE